MYTYIYIKKKHPYLYIYVYKCTHIHTSVHCYYKWLLLHFKARNRNNLLCPDKVANRK